MKGKENLVKDQKVTKYYVHKCLQICFLLFMTLLTAQIVKSSHVLAVIFYLLNLSKKRPRPNLKVFQH